MKESFFLTLLFLIIIVLLTVSETLSHNFSKDIILYDKKNICFELFQGLNTLVNCLNLKELKQKEKLMIENDFDLLFKNLESNLINNDQIRLKLRNSVIEIYDENLQMDKFFLNKYDFLNLIKALISISLKKISLVRFNIIISFKQIFLKVKSNYFLISEQNEINISSSPLNEQYRLMISQNNSCIKFYDCFNCSSYMEGFQSLCKWEENMCKEKTEKTIENSWFNLFNNCSNDSSSSLIMNEYCGKPTSNISIISNTISLKMKNDIYSPKNLYCKWQILNMSIETTVNFNFTLLKFDPNQDKYTFIIMFNKEKNLYIDISDSKYFQTDNIMSIVLHYTSNETKIYLPFYFNFQYLTQNMTTYSVMTYLMLIIASIIGFLFFVLCIRSFINNIFERFISANSNSNIEIHQVNTEFDNLKMFVNEFKPILYSENFNEFSCLCTICLENFIDNVEVIKLECKHLYHYKCLNDWLSKNQRMLKCPNCNNKIISRKSIEVNICSPDSNNNNVYLNT